MIAVLKSSKSLIESRLGSFTHSVPYHRNTSISILDSIVKLDIYPQEPCLSDISLSFSSTSSLPYSIPDFPKPKKWRDATKELALFTVKRNQDHNLFYLNDTQEFEQDEYDFDDPPLSPPPHAQIKPKKLKLKKLLKSKQFKSIRNHQILLNSNMSKKKNCKFLYVKHNLWYEKLVDGYFNLYVNKINRAKCLYSTRKIDARSKSNEFLIESKKFFKSLRLIIIV